MSAEVIECCHGPVVQYRGKGRCAADQGGRTMEVKLGNFTRTATDVYELDGTEVPVFEIDPDSFAMNCVNAIVCLTSTDPCGNQIMPTGVGVTHVLVEEPATDRGRVLLVLSGTAGPLSAAPAGLELWLRFFGN